MIFIIFHLIYRLDLFSVLDNSKIQHRTLIDFLIYNSCLTSAPRGFDYDQ